MLITATPSRYAAAAETRLSHASVTAGMRQNMRSSLRICSAPADVAPLLLAGHVVLQSFHGYVNPFLDLRLGHHLPKLGIIGIECN